MRERLKRIFILFMAAAVSSGGASTAFTALADEKETENEDLEIPRSSIRMTIMKWCAS